MKHAAQIIRFLWRFSNKKPLVNCTSVLFCSKDYFPLISIVKCWQYVLNVSKKKNDTNFCIQFRITLKSMRSQCHGQRESLNVQLNSRPVIRIENRKVCTASELPTTYLCICYFMLQPLIYNVFVDIKCELLCIFAHISAMWIWHQVYCGMELDPMNLLESIPQGTNNLFLHLNETITLVDH